MRFPDPGQQAAQRAAQEAQRAAQRAAQEAQRAAQQAQQQQMLHNRQVGMRRRAGGPAPKRGCCSTLIFLVLFLIIVAFIGYVILNIAQFHL